MQSLANHAAHDFGHLVNGVRVPDVVTLREFVDGLATIKTVLERQVPEVAKAFSTDLRQEVESAARDTVQVLTRTGQSILDESELEVLGLSGLPGIQRQH
ncbi:MAG: hypothetical protein F4X97_11005 [Boseongicola sp. SB0662_bin_57]|nr:hypothetical protein [Boseongicola sp. SB0662_bin_57]